MLPATLILLAGCAGTGAVPTDPCGPWRPILIAEQDRMTDRTSEDILAHNLTGERLCGWKGRAP